MDMINYLKDVIDLTALVNTKAVSGVRYNPLKLTKEAFLKLFPMDVTPNLYYDGGYRLLAEKEGVGNHPLHQGGGCYFQEPSAMSALTALGVENGDKVLDLCAAPGSKATAIACANPDGITVVNEVHPARAKILLSNMERMGISRALITSAEADQLAKAFGGYFDKILIDSPCSGEGMFRKYPEILNDWTEELVHMCARRSREILSHGVKMLRPGGRLVYSTCTFNLEENEKTILWLLENYPEFEIEERQIKGTSAGFLGLASAHRLFPDEKGEGHFVCALRKKENAHTETVKTERFTQAKPLADLERMLQDILKDPACLRGKKEQFVMLMGGENAYLIPSDLPNPRGIRVLRAGVQAARLKGRTFVPSHHLYTAAAAEDFRQVCVPNDDEAAAFLRGEGLGTHSRGFTAVVWNGLCLGFGKGVDGVLKNYYPKGLRIK